MNGMQFGQFQPQQAMINPYTAQMSQYMNRYAQAPNNGITWVQGIEGAKAYQLAPNSNVLLMDSDNDGVFYIKVSDNVGMCNLRTFKFIETTGQTSISQPHEIDMSNYVTKEELQEALKAVKGGKSNGKSTVPANDTKSIITE